jgi:TonB family protein
LWEVFEAWTRTKTENEKHPATGGAIKMNAVKKLVIVLSLGALSGIASAATTEKAYVASYAGVSDLPVPTKVVAPNISSPVGAEVILKFVIDKTGVPVGIEVASSNDNDLAEAALKAVQQWRFTPLMRNGEAIDAKVKLPFRTELPNLDRNRFVASY